MEESEHSQLWRNKYSRQIAEVYKLAEIPTQQDLDRYEFRCKNKDIVNVMHIVQAKN